eukprot:GFUD01099343.1.p1 GENE.GFUD01099343.1~~GFUD01099343.1.p1  ORF type:complete len:239 (-),score=32.59 GFUD01099343.1:345-1061(-)
MMIRFQIIALFMFLVVTLHFEGTWSKRKLKCVGKFKGSEGDILNMKCTRVGKKKAKWMPVDTSPCPTTTIAATMTTTIDQTCTQSGRYEGNISKTFQYSGNFSRCNKTCIAPECKFWTFEFSTFGLPPLPPGNCTQFSSVSEFIPPPGGNGRVAFISSDPTCQPGFYDGTEVANFKVFPSNENVCVLSCSNTAACNFWSYGVPAMKPPPIGYCRLFSSVSKYIHQLIGVNWSSGETSH